MYLVSLMVTLQESLLQSEFEQICQALFRLTSEDSQGDLSESLKACNSLSLLHNDSFIGAICGQLHDLVNKNQTESSLTPEEQNFLKRGCEELRFRIIATAMGVRSSTDSSDMITSVESAEQTLRSSSLHFEPSGVVYAKLEQHIVILLPRIESSAHLESVTYVLDDVAEKVKGNLNWIVDFSAVKSLPVELLGAIIYHISRLHDQGAVLFLSWLKKDSLTQAQSKALVRLLDLVDIGGYWFSSGKTK